MLSVLRRQPEHYLAAAIQRWLAYVFRCVRSHVPMCLYMSIIIYVYVYISDAYADIKQVKPSTRKFWETTLKYYRKEAQMYSRIYSLHCKYVWCIHHMYCTMINSKKLLQFTCILIARILVALIWCTTREYGDVIQYKWTCILRLALCCPIHELSTGNYECSSIIERMLYLCVNTMNFSIGFCWNVFIYNIKNWLIH